MTRKCFGRTRYKPPGDWVQTTGLFEVAGVASHRCAAQAFAQAVRKAEASGFVYGLRLTPEPNNRNDRNAIAIEGFATVKPWFGAPYEREWRIGYVPASDAAEVTRDLIMQGVSIAGELYDITTRDDFLDIRGFVLAPAGHGLAARLRRSAPPTPERAAPAGTPFSLGETLSEADRLTARMISTPKPDVQALWAAASEARRAAANRMLEEGLSWGEASGGPLAFLSEPDGSQQLAAMEHDLSSQLRVVSASFDHYLAIGETPAPYYPYRVCVLLRKLKERDREKAFLAAWCRHFGDVTSGRYGQLVERARKAGVL